MIAKGRKFTPVVSIRFLVSILPWNSVSLSAAIDMRSKKKCTFDMC